MYWGHMKSKDLVHWIHLPIAFGPSWEKGENGCWSGSCIAGPGGLPHAMYTSIGKDRPALDKSEQWLVVGSKDMGRWEKSPANPVMTHALHGKLRIEDWRDPFAWCSGDTYYCVAGGNIVQEGSPSTTDRVPLQVARYGALDVPGADVFAVQRPAGRRRRPRREPRHELGVPAVLPARR